MKGVYSEVLHFPNVITTEEFGVEWKPESFEIYGICQPENENQLEFGRTKKDLDFFMDALETIFKITNK